MLTALELQLALFLIDLLLCLAGLAAVFSIIDYVNAKLGTAFAWIALIAIVTAIIWIL
jgi:hypothetical protein